MTKTYSIFSSKWSTFEAGIAKLNKRAAKLGVSPITFVKTGNVKTVSVTRRDSLRPDDHFGFTEAQLNEVVYVKEFIEVEVTGETPKFAGWSLAAVIETTPEGNILRKSPGVEIELARYRTCQPECEHCNTARHRKETFVVLHENGTTKQVGRNCIGDFLGAKDPHALAQQAELDYCLGELCGSCEDGSEGGFGGTSDSLIHVGSFLTYVSLACRLKGYVSRKAEQASQEAGGNVESTRNYANWLMFPPKNAGRGYRSEPVPKPEQIDSDRADAARQYVLDTLGAKEASTLSDFESSVLIACKCEAVSHRNLGLLAFVVEYHAREIDKSLQRAREFGRAKDAGHFGTVKDRVRDTEIIYTKSTGFDSQFGYTYIHTFRTAVGHLLIWKTGTELSVAPGTRVIATFTVKEHSEWNGTPQTKITRVVYAEKPELKEVAA